MLRFFNLILNRYSHAYSQGPWGPWGPWTNNGANNAGNKGSNNGSNSGSNGGSGGSSGGNGGANNDQKNSGPNGSQPNDPNPNNNKQNPKKPNENSFFDKINQFFKNLFSNDNKNSNNNDNFNKEQKRNFGLIALTVLTLWLVSGFYKIDPDENGIILYFGKFSYVSTPGLNYYIPFPFGKLIKKSVTAVNTEEFTHSKNQKSVDSSTLMLTGDENIVDIEFQVQWQISDIQSYVFNIANPDLAIRKAAESAMREVIARTPISEALSDGKSRIEQTTRDLLQQNLDLYKAGVRIVLVQLRRVDPPSQVIDAFRDVQTAKADKEREINQAQAYANDIVPRARGLAAQMHEQSEAYKQEVIANAQGEAERFLSVYKQYSMSKQITKKRIYLETMEKIYRDMDKVVVGREASKAGVTPYFPINDLSKPKTVETK